MLKVTQSAKNMKLGLPPFSTLFFFFFSIPKIKNSNSSEDKQKKLQLELFGDYASWCHSSSSGRENVSCLCFQGRVGTCVKIIMLGSAYLQVNNQLLIICWFLQNRIICSYTNINYGKSDRIILNWFNYTHFYTLFNCISHWR